MALPSLLDEIDRLFDELVRRPWEKVLHQVAPADIRTVEDGWVIQLPVEGFAAGDLEVQLEGNRLTVLGRRTATRGPRASGQRGRTRRVVAVHRTLTLPSEADPSDIDASLEDDTLTIHIRKRSPWRKLIRSSKP
jgi:HSP20 family molecular chaperone IbpA